jgi:hypothetical protein
MRASHWIEPLCQMWSMNFLGLNKDIASIIVVEKSSFVQESCSRNGTLSTLKGVLVFWEIGI